MKKIRINKKILLLLLTSSLLIFAVGCQKDKTENLSSINDLEYKAVTASVNDGVNNYSLSGTVNSEGFTGRYKDLKNDYKPISFVFSDKLMLNSSSLKDYLNSKNIEFVIPESEYVVLEDSSLVNIPYELMRFNRNQILNMLGKQSEIKISDKLKTKEIFESNSSLFNQLGLKYSETIIIDYSITKTKNQYFEVLTIADGENVQIIQIVTEDSGEPFELVVPENVEVIGNNNSIPETTEGEVVETTDIDDFYKEKYPKAYDIKRLLIQIGYEEPNIETSVKDIFVYAIRKSRTIGLDENIPDEVSINIKDNVITEVKLINSYSKADYESFRDEIIGYVVEDVSRLMDLEFFINAETKYGKFEEINNLFDSVVSIKEVSINETTTIVTIEVEAFKR